MPFLHNGEVFLFYTTHGSNSGASPLVFVHGWTCDSNDWVWQLSHFSSARTCLALDLRGHGQSSVPSSGFRLADYATDVVAALEEVGPAVLVGHSMGALVSSLVAVDRADLVKALVVVDAPYALEADVVLAAAAFADRVKGVDGIEQVLDWLTGADGPATPAWLAMWHRRRILAMPQHALIETVVDVHQSAASIANSPNSDSFSWARRSMPVLAVGTQEVVAEQERAHFKDHRSRAVTVEGCGHWIHQERPGEFNDLLEDWLCALD